MSVGMRAGVSLPSERPSDGGIRVFLIDDHEVVSEGLKAILGREPDMEVVGTADSAERGLELLHRTDPDVVVLDHRLPGMNGVELCREIAERRLRAQVVILSAFLEEETVEAALHAGARAYVVKDVEPEELKRAIRTASRGQTTIDPKVAGRFVQWAARLEADPGGKLSPAQLAILRRLVEGRPTTEIARLTGLSAHTVRSYMRGIYEKLGVGTKSEAVSIAVRRGLV